MAFYSPAHYIIIASLYHFVKPVNNVMSTQKTRLEKKADDIFELLDHYVYPTTGETLAAQKGLMVGWLARLATTDWTVAEELERRLHLARKQKGKI
jgi:hypothetical protein